MRTEVIKVKITFAIKFAVVIGQRHCRELTDILAMS